MKIEINGVELDVHRTLRTDMVYEDKFGKPLDIHKINQRTLVELFCANVIAAQMRQKVDIMSVDEIMDWLEADPIREMYVGTTGKEWADQYVKYITLVQDYYTKEQKKKKNKKTNSVDIETVDDEKKS